MYRYLILFCIAFGANSHEFTPTYPKLQPSELEGVLKVTMQLFNRREDIEYYEIEAFDKDNKPIPFATYRETVQVKYLERKNLEIYFRSKDRDKVTYVCTKSKILTGNKKASVISSKICSKIKR